MKHILAGAQFDLLDENKNIIHHYTTTDSELLIDAQTSGDPNFDVGKVYYLHETKAPDGYIVDPTYYQFTIGATSNYDQNIYVSGDTLKIRNVAYTEATIEKLWNDNGNQYDSRLPKVTFTLKKTVNAAKTTEVVGNYDLTSENVVKDENGNATNEWKYTVKNLPATDNDGNSITYFWTEQSMDGTKYVSSEPVKDNNDSTVTTITNTLTGTTSVTATKTWVDGNNSNRTRPSTITLQLKKTVNNVTTPVGDPVVLSADNVNPSNANEWTYIFTGLDKYDDQGSLITYTVEETKIGETAPSATEYDSVSDGMHVTNTLTGTTSVTAEKKWVDNNDQDGLRTKSVVLQLQKSVNGSDVVDVPDQTLTLSVDNNWNGTLTDLDKYDEKGFKIDYSFREVTKIDGYTTSYSKDGLTAINTHTPAVTTAVVTKTWDDKDNLYQVRPESVTFQLQKTVNGTTSNVEGKTVELNEKNGWTYTFEDLPKYEGGKEITYTAVETSTDKNYTSSASGLTVKNTLITGKLVIKKTFSGASISEDAKNKLSFTITGPNNYSKTVTYAEFTNGEYDLDYLLAGEYTVTETNNVVDSFRNGTTYTVNGASGHVATVDAKNTPVFQIQNTYMETPKTPGDQPKRPTTPNTGDQTNLPLSAAGMLLGTFAAVFALFFKKKYSL